MRRTGATIGAAWLSMGLLLACGTSSDSADAGLPPGPDGSSTDGQSVGDATDAGADAIALDAAPDDPCPNLPIPKSCYGRSVVYREWSDTVTGDGTYFVGQEPVRLGFDRTYNNIWIVKFRLEDNTYNGLVSAYGDQESDVTWISDKPCDGAFGVASKLVKLSGDLAFVVARNASDEAQIKTNPTYAALASKPLLRGNHCYYVAYENAKRVGAAPIDLTLISTAPDPCAAGCSYLAMEFRHRLTGVAAQAQAASNIPGLTLP